MPVQPKLARVLFDESHSEAWTIRPEVARTLAEHPEVTEAWSITGDADAIARVRTSDNADLERLIIDLQRNGLVERTRSQVVLSRLVRHG